MTVVTVVTVVTVDGVDFWEIHLVALSSRPASRSQQKQTTAPAETRHNRHKSRHNQT